MQYLDLKVNIQVLQLILSQVLSAVFYEEGKQAFNYLEAKCSTPTNQIVIILSRKWYFKLINHNMQFLTFCQERPVKSM